jgi:CheY-like chemotaxis protein
LQGAVARAVDELKPAPDAPPSARIRRIHGILLYRYVQGMTQEEVAERLGITARHLRREQTEAVRALALHLWEQHFASTAAETAPAGWRAQVREELALLREGAPYVVSDVNEVMHGAAALGRLLAGKQGVALAVEDAQPPLSVAIHPAALRQVILAAVAQLAARMAGGQITLAARSAGRRVRLTITGSPIAPSGLPAANFIEEALDAPEGTVTLEEVPGGAAFHIELPLLEHVVLVVDDNHDMAHLYRRYTAGAGFYIVHAAQGQRALAAAEACSPSVIVLDVMLPDLDGWTLLAQLREHPSTRNTPVVVCSVVPEEALALALGATQCLRKPIQRERFLQALQAAVQPPA